MKKKEIIKEKPEKLGGKITEEIQEIEKKKAEEKEFLTEEEKFLKEKLEREIKLMKFSPKLQDEATKKAQKIKTLDIRGKIKNLLAVAEEMGVSFAVKVAEDMEDPYTLDIFHDILAREGLFKKYKK
jgi:hypothetical protein